MDAGLESIRAYHALYGYSFYQKSGYEKFMSEMVPHIVTENSDIIVDSKSRRERHIIEMGRCKVFKPTICESDGTVRAMTPNEARIRRLTYSCSVSCDLHHTTQRYAHVVQVADAVDVCYRPTKDSVIMCGVLLPTDGGGYVLTEGSATIAVELGIIDIVSECKPIAAIGTVVDGGHRTFRANLVSTASDCKSWINALHPRALIEQSTHHCEKVPLLDLPCMAPRRFCNLRGCPQVIDECIHGDGGYFIVNGNEKVLQGQEKLRINKPFCFVGKSQSKFAYTNEVRSCHNTKWRSTSTLRMSITHKVPYDVVVVVPFVMRGCVGLEIPIICILRLLGGSTPREILREILAFDHSVDPRVLRVIQRCIEHPMGSLTCDEVRRWMGTEGTREKNAQKRDAYCLHIIRNEYLPHLGMDHAKQTLFKKRIFTGMMLRHLVEVRLGLRHPCDRDSYINKRLDGPGPLLAILFRQLFRNHLKMFRSQLHKAIEQGKWLSGSQFINSRKITSGIRYHFATGNWSQQKGVNTGVVQVLSRMSVQSMRSHLKRMSTPINRDGKLAGPRMLHSSTWGIVCPSESPEGSSCGLIKNLAIMTHVTTNNNAQEVERVLPPFDQLPPPGVAFPPDFVMVLLNGDIVGCLSRHKVPAYKSRVRSMRRSLDLPVELGICSTRDTLRVNLDHGRCIRPVFIASELQHLPVLRKKAKDLQINIFNLLLEEGVIEYLDKEEEQECLIAEGLADFEARTTIAFTHVELHATVIFGSAVAQIPNSHCNQAPRNIYQAAMGKQAVTIPSTAYLRCYHRTHLYIMHPTYPLVATTYGMLPGVRELPTGTESIVAICCLGGSNQEDSVLVKRSSVERGWAHITYYKTFRDSLTSRGAEDEEFRRPPDDAVGLCGDANYDLLGEDGVVSPGTWVARDDVIIGKVVQVHDFDQSGAPVVRMRCRSTILRKNENGIVDDVIISIDKDGKQMVIVRIRKHRVPMIGDKFSSRHGQKGTVGRVVADHDLPFNPLTGMRPDIVVNPQAIPSRMTIGQLIECLQGKLGAVEGRFSDATAFRQTNLDGIGDRLADHGYDRHGDEQLYSGCSGRPLSRRVFIGPTYYQRLRHMVEDKMHSRATGPNQSLTRQPMEGRSRNGGLRFGEMERDQVIGHGAANVLRDRLHKCSDASYQHICKVCGNFGDHPRSQRFGISVHGNKSFCKFCSSTANTVPVEIPYSTKLLTQELNALHIKTTYEVTPHGVTF